MPLREIEEHGRVATSRIHAPSRSFGFEPVLFQRFAADHATHAVFPINDVVGAAIAAQYDVGTRQRLKPPTALLAVFTIANAVQNRRA